MCIYTYTSYIDSEDFFGDDFLYSLFTATYFITIVRKTSMNLFSIRGFVGRLPKSFNSLFAQNI